MTGRRRRTPAVKGWAGAWHGFYDIRSSWIPRPCITRLDHALRRERTSSDAAVIQWRIELAARENLGVIGRDEIDATGKLLGVHAVDVQRDYLYGWLLAGLYGDHPVMRDRLVLKGGNAFRKGYFVNTRFSGDLDFAAPTALNPGQLLDALNNACRMIQARTGVEFDLDRNAQTGQRSIDRAKTVHKFTLYFKDFYGKASKMTIALRMDVTEFGRLYLPIQQRELIHPYSDRADCAVTLEVVSLEEALADKLKCLLQRHMSNDLFDLVYSIFVNNDVAVDRTAIVTTFLRKTIFESSPQAALGLLLAVRFEVMRGYWNKIVCVTESRMDFTMAVDRFNRRASEAPCLG